MITVSSCLDAHQSQSIIQNTGFGALSLGSLLSELNRDEVRVRHGVLISAPPLPIDGMRDFFTTVSGVSKERFITNTLNLLLTRIILRIEK